MDFSKIIEVFDSHGVSFVSVTQQFNTTTSMGRLTLNVLLSFAQFEREVTGERIRDKIAASKRKGMWMGGCLPLGYDSVDRHLIVNQAEAETVREIFHQYLRLGCITKLRDHLDGMQIRSKVRSNVTGRMAGGATFSRGALHHVLRNRIYIGDIIHGEKSYQGQHEAIISRELWDQVSARLAAKNHGRRKPKSQATQSLLRGILFDPNGVRFTPTHAVKNGKRYRYYTSQTAINKTGKTPNLARIPAQELENLVTSQIVTLLKSPDQCVSGVEGPEREVVLDRIRNFAERWNHLDAIKKDEFARCILRRVIVGQATVWVEVDRGELLERFLGREFQDGELRMRDAIRLAADFQFSRRGSEVRLILPNNPCSGGVPTPSLVNAIARSCLWYERIVAGEIHSIEQLAKEVEMLPRSARRVLRWATLSPRLTESILSGKRTPLTVQNLPGDLPLCWEEQERRFSQTLA